MLKSSQKKPKALAARKTLATPKASATQNKKNKVPAKMQPVFITTTTSTLPEAEAIAAVLLKQNLVACVNIIGPVSSYYQWQGKLVSDTEYKLLIKTVKKNWPQVELMIKNNHSYTVPEISMIEVCAQHKPYTNWIFSVIE